MGYRDYDPETARFTAKDPLGPLGGCSDLYDYCLDDPINLVDPEGLTAKKAGADSDYAARNTSCPSGVWRYTRPAETGGGLLPHDWLKTNNVEAGLGEADGTIPNVKNPSTPGISQTAIVDHSGQSERPSASGKCLPDANATIVDQELKVGKRMGVWTPANNCQTLTEDVIRKATPKKPWEQTPILGEVIE